MWRHPSPVIGPAAARLNTPRPDRPWQLRADHPPCARSRFRHEKSRPKAAFSEGRPKPNHHLLAAAAAAAAAEAAASATAAPAAAAPEAAASAAAEAAPATAVAAEAAASATGAATAGAAAGASSFLPQAVRAAAAIREASRSDLFIGVSSVKVSINVTGMESDVSN